MLFPSVLKSLHVWRKGFLLRNPFRTVSKGIGQKSVHIVPGEAEGGLVRSLVPKEKNSTAVAISSAVGAARGISIIVSTR
jgi:hypothetical protein